MCRTPSLLLAGFFYSTFLGLTQAPPPRCVNGGCAPLSATAAAAITAINSPGTDLHSFKSYYVAGDYAVAGVGVRGSGAGVINMTDVPANADVLAAYLYWETFGDGQHGTFRGNAIAGEVLGTASSPCWPEPTITVYRADVLRLLPVDANGRSVVNGTHTVTFPDSGDFNAAPSTEGASLVVVYNYPGLPLRGVTIYDGAFTVNGSQPTFNLTLQGFGHSSANPQSKMTHIVGDGQTGPGFSDRLSINGVIVGNPNDAFHGARGPLWDNLTIDTSAAVGTNSSQISTGVDNTPFIQQGFDCLTWGAVVFSTTIQQLEIEFITKGSDGSLIPQKFTYNSAPCPVIDARVERFSTDTDKDTDKDSNVQLKISGKVTDQASDLVYNPASQPISLDIAVGSFYLKTVQLYNTAQPAPPWRPYAYEAPFSAQLSFKTLGFGEFPIELSTAVNVAGCGGSLGFTIFVEPDSTKVVADAVPTPGTFLPTMLRFRGPPEAISPSETKIVAFDRSWDIKSIDFGDGTFWYAVDPLQNAVVFLPAAYAHSFIQTKKLDLAFEAQVVDGKHQIGKKSIALEQGLLVDNDDVQALLGNVTNLTKKQYLVRKNNNATDLKNVFVYNPAPGNVLAHTNNNLDTEILWRYVGTAGTITRFSSQKELETDVAYRQKVVAAARAWGAPFGETRVHGKFWDGFGKVKPGGTASAAIADIFDDPKKYRMACQAAATYVCERAASQVLANFDAFVGLQPIDNEKNLLARDQQPTTGDLDTNNPNNAKWIPGDWGYIKNADRTNTGANRNLFLAGENVIYLGGSFDTNLADFRTNADFWGLLDANGNNVNNIRKLQKWIDSVTVFTDKQGMSPAAIQPRRDHLKSPRVACPASEGQAGVNYSSALAAEGGEPLYTFTAAGLPAGLTVNPTTGAVTGTPGALAKDIDRRVFSFSVQIMDSTRTMQGTATSKCTITISKQKP